MRRGSWASHRGFLPTVPTRLISMKSGLLHAFRKHPGAGRRSAQFLCEGAWKPLHFRDTACGACGSVTPWRTDKSLEPRWKEHNTILVAKSGSADSEDFKS